MAAASLALAAPASAGEDLVSYVTEGKLRPGKRIAYQVVCSANCQLTVTSTLKVLGPDPAPVSNTDVFDAGEVAEAFLRPNKPLRQAIRDHIGAAKLVTEVTASDLATGVTDRDERTFRFKKKKR